MHSTPAALERNWEVDLTEINLKLNIDAFFKFKNIENKYVTVTPVLNITVLEKYYFLLNNEVTIAFKHRLYDLCPIMFFKIELIKDKSEIPDYIAGYIIENDQTDHNYVKVTNFTYFVNRRKLKIVSLVVSNIIQELEKIFKLFTLFFSSNSYPINVDISSPSHEQRDPNYAKDKNSKQVYKLYSTKFTKRDLVYTATEEIYHPPPHNLQLISWISEQSVYVPKLNTVSLLGTQMFYFTIINF
ncbi:hypothetical protein AGLY_000359 [Aphis glycines]|uniref:Uncharacterized protein n=1 Tax=Aphis glycines TaxID=307491 RepID=A0A6G0U788_APHGL|nr:hypothetical protein AGLY_000359 [Aphis glycines]